jgi:hypothetical protein
MDYKQNLIQTPPPAKNFTKLKRVPAGIRKIKSRVSGMAKAAAAPVRNLRPKRKPARILLYRNESVIKEMRGRVVAAVRRDEKIWQRLIRAAKLRRSPLVSEDFTFDGIAGVDEFVLKPVLKSTTPAEIGVELELKWILSNEADLDTVILVLLSVMSKKGVSAKDLVCQVENQGVSTPVEDLVYPGRPINMWGMVMHGDDLVSTAIHLHDLYDEDYSVRVILGEL